VGKVMSKWLVAQDTAHFYSAWKNGRSMKKNMFYFGHGHSSMSNSQLLITTKNKEIIGCRFIVRPIL
jgi:hypothetical protein